MDDALALGATMDLQTFTLLDRLHCRCEALCTCGWWERWLADHGYREAG